MSFFANVEKLGDEAWEHLESSPVATMADNAFNTAIADLKKLTADQLENLAQRASRAASASLLDGPRAALAAAFNAVATSGIAGSLSTVTLCHLAASVVNHMIAPKQKPAAPTPGTNAPLPLATPSEPHPAE